MENISAVIAAGGLGTRLKTINITLHKSFNRYKSFLYDILTDNTVA